MIFNTHYPYTRKKTPPEPEVWDAVPIDGVIFNGSIVGSGITYEGIKLNINKRWVIEANATGNIYGVVFSKNTTTLRIAYYSEYAKATKVSIDGIERELTVNNGYHSIDVADIANNSPHTISITGAKQFVTIIDSVIFNI